MSSYHDYHGRSAEGVEGHALGRIARPIGELMSPPPRSGVWGPRYGPGCYRVVKETDGQWHVYGVLPVNQFRQRLVLVAIFPTEPEADKYVWSEQARLKEQEPAAA